MPGGLQVRTPDGTNWIVARRWIPHRDGIGLHARLLRRRRRSERRDGDRWYDWIDVSDIGFEIDAIAIVVVAVLAAVAFVLLGWPLILLGIDLLWLVLVLIVGTIARVVLRRPWRVEARSGDERRAWFVQGFRDAGRWRDEIAERFRHGADPRPGDGAEPDRLAG